MNYHVVDIEHVFNLKSHDFLNIHFPQHERFTIHKCKSVLEFDFLIQKYKNDSNVVIIIYFCIPQEFINQYLMDKIRSYKSQELKLKILLFTYDYWYNGFGPLWEKLMTNIYEAENHYVLTFADSLEQIEFYHAREYQKYKDKYIYFNLWSAYDSAFVEFNLNPKMKIAISGAPYPNVYPERHLLSNLSHIDDRIICLDFNSEEKNYTKRLNEYLCCFVSPPHVQTLKMVDGKKRYINTNLITLKYFEVLASGSLLLCFNTEEKPLNKIGLFNKKNCIITSLKDLNKTITYILNPLNREEIDRIRKSGQEIAKNKFNSKKRFEELLEVLDNNFSLKQ